MSLKGVPDEMPQKDKIKLLGVSYRHTNDGVTLKFLHLR